MDCHVHLGGPTLVRVRAQLIPDHALEPADRSLRPGSLRVSGRCLPSPPAPLGDELKVAIPLGRRSLGRPAWHRGRAWWHNDSCFGMALGDAGGDALLIVRAVTRE